MRIALTIIINLVACCLGAQPLISTDQFPGSGDTLFFLTDELPERINISGPGEAQNWNYASLQAPLLQSLHVDPDPENESELKIRGAQNLQSQYEVSDNAFRLISQHYQTGATTTPVKIRWQPGLPEIIGDMRYEDDLDYESVGEAIIDKADWTEVLSTHVPQKIERIKLVVKINRRMTADAWGSLLIPGGFYDALRVRVDDEYQTEVLLDEGSGEWQSGDPILAEVLVPLKMQTQYRFYAQGITGEVATAYLGEEGVPTKVTYWANPQHDRFYESTNPKQRIYAFPNPSFGNTRIKLNNLPAGNYSVKFYNILGKELFENFYEISSPATFKIDLSSLQKGTYLYALIDERGKKLVTRRIIVLKP